MFLISVIGVLLLWVLYMEWKRRSMIYRTRDVKSVNLLSLPLVGHAIHFIGTDEDRMNKIKYLARDAIKTGGLATVQLGPDLMYIVVDPDIAEIGLKTCLEKGFMYDCLKLNIGNGVLTSPVKIWRPRRKLVNRVFTQKNLDQFVKVFSDESQRMVHAVKDKADSDGLDMWPHLSAYTLDSVLKTILGGDMSKSLIKSFLNSFERVAQLTSQRVLQPWLYNDSIYKLLPCWKVCVEGQNVMYGIIDKIVLSTKDRITSQNIDPDENDNKPKDILSFKTIIEILLQHHKDEYQLSDVEVREEALVIALGGNDTSASSSGFTLALLAQHPDIQEKVLAEQIEIYGDSDRPVEPGDLAKMKYLEAVIKESLRLYPPLPAVVRSMDRDIKLPSGQTLHKGTQFMVLIWGIHRNPRYWGDDADTFRPERFLEPLTHNAYMPFSFGPRNCVGYKYAFYSMKTVLSIVLRNYKILPAKATDAFKTPEEIASKFLIIMKGVDNYHLRLQRRKQ